MFNKLEREINLLKRVERARKELAAREREMNAIFAKMSEEAAEEYMEMYMFTLEMLGEYRLKSLFDKMNEDGLLVFIKAAMKAIKAEDDFETCVAVFENLRKNQILRAYTNMYTMFDDYLYDNVMDIAEKYNLK